MYRIAICDDEAAVRSRIRNMLERYAGESGRQFDYVLFSSANELLREYQSEFDLLLLDIAMNGIDGMSAAREIRKMDREVCIIFVTSMQQYAIEGYSVRAFGFVTKPFYYPEFSFEVESALNHVDAKRLAGDTILLRNRGRMDRITVSDILYCEVENHSVMVHLHSEARSYRYQMKEMAKLLEKYGFFRPHSSYLVNCRAIDQIGADFLLLKDGRRIPISQHKRKEFLDALTKYLGGSL